MAATPRSIIAGVIDSTGSPPSWAGLAQALGA
jgi:hypothetical protein